MEQAISQAKIQTAKEITTNAKKKRVKKIFFIYAIIIIVLLVLLYFVILFIQNNRYGFVDKESGITFQSGDFYLTDAMSSLSKDQNIYLVLNVLPEDINNFGQISSQITYASAVLAYKNKNVTMIINVMDKTRSTISCLSNLGDIYTSKELTKEECYFFLSSGVTSIIIDFPKSELKESIVVTNANIGERYIYIQVRTIDELERAVYLTLSLLFPDLNDVENSINNFKTQLSNDSNTQAIDVNATIDVNSLQDENAFGQSN